MIAERTKDRLKKARSDGHILGRKIDPAKGPSRTTAGRQRIGARSNRDGHPRCRPRRAGARSQFPGSKLKFPTHTDGNTPPCRRFHSVVWKHQQLSGDWKQGNPLEEAQMAR